MSELKTVLEKGDVYRKVIGAVYNNPYAEKKDIFKELNIGESDLESALGELEEKMIILSLTSQADSNIESRVPKRIFLINPDLENEIRELM